MLLDLLKKIGVPGTVAAVVASLVTMVPFLFQVDERYAKADDVEKVVRKMERQNEQLSREIAQLAGFQQAMITLIQQGRVPVAHAEVAVVPVPTPVPSVAPAPRVMAAPRVESREPPRLTGSAAPAPEPIASAPKIEKPRTWTEINDGLLRQQNRLIKE